MKNIIKKLTPQIILNFYRFLKIKLKEKIFFFKLTIFSLIKKDIKLIIGSGNTSFIDWLSSDYPWFDITNLDSIYKYFKFKKIDKVLAEHVFEHLTLEDGIKSIKNIKRVLKVNGVIRIAVPDGFNPNKHFIDYVKPNGSGPGAEDHKILYNYISIKKLFDEDFSLNFLEFFDENGKFKSIDWLNNSKVGYIKRSRFEDKRNNKNEINFNSIILDAKLIK